MGLIDKCTIFVNRTEEIKQLGVNILNTTNTTACIICASKGVGKSEFIKKLINEYNLKHKCIIITPQKINLKNSSIHGQYLQSIFSSLYKYQQPNNSIEEVLKLAKGETFKKYCYYVTKKSENNLSIIIQFLMWSLPLLVSIIGLYDSLKKRGIIFFCIGMILLLIAIFIQYLYIKNPIIKYKCLSKANKCKVESYLEDDTSNEAFDLKFDYIKEILNKGGYLLYLDNIEYIDGQSLKALSQCMNCCENDSDSIHNYFILEYGYANDINIEDIKEALNSNWSNTYHPLDIHTYELPSLKEEHITKIAGEIIELTSDIENSISIFWNTQAKGNLFELIRHINALKNTNSKEPSIEDVFVNLTKQQKYILILLIYSGGIIKKDVFIEFLNMQQTLYFYEADLKVLTVNNIIEENNQIFKCNESILNNWRTLYRNYGSIEYAGLSQYSEYFNQLFNKENQIKNTLIDQIMDFYFTFYQSRVITCVSYIQKYAKLRYDGVYLEQCFSKLLDFYKSVTNTHKNYELVDLALCCYNLELYSIGLKFIEMVQDDNNSSIALKAMLLHRCDKYVESNTFCTLNILSNNNDSRLVFILKQIQMINHRMLYNIGQCRDLFIEIKKNLKYKDYYEYGFFLRNAEIVIEINESIGYLKKSILFFKRRNDIKNTAISKLSYAMQLARIGKLRLAEKIIKESEKELEPYPIIAQHYFKVDLAAIYLLSKKRIHEIQNLLSKAELTAYTTFDKLVILVNRIAYCILENDLENFYYIVDKVKKEKIEIIQIYRSIYYNISIMYEKIGNLDEAAYFMEKSIQCHNQVIRQNPKLPLNPLWDARYTKDSSLLKKDLLFMYEQPYHVSFISFWHFDIPNF